MRTARATIAAAAAAALALAAPSAHGALISQGAVRMGADALWSQGFTGQGQTVAVLDLGFGGLDASIADGELPPRSTLTLRSFDAEFGFSGRTAIGGPTQHGVRMAEIVHDLAPDSHLVLVNYHTQAEFAAAAAWIVSRGIPIISHSNSFLTPPFDGTGPSARAVDAVAARGVLWINSAGNYGRRHWAGRAVPGGTVLPISPGAGQHLQMSLDVRGTDATASIERSDGGPWQGVVVTPPGGGLTPVVRADGGRWRVVVRQPTGAPAELEVFSRTVGFGAAAVPEGSVPTPGDAAGALAVGAVRWTRTTLEPYSSRGPTNDGRAKPDVVAPTYVTSHPAWPGTAGTSASTAHVAGAAALLRQVRAANGLAHDAASLRADLARAPLDLGPSGPDLAFGVGQVRLDRTAPRVRLRINRSRTRATVQAVDRGTIRRVQVFVNGRRLARARRAGLLVRLPKLGPGRHRLEVRAEDLAGNLGQSVRTLRGARRGPNSPS